MKEKAEINRSGIRCEYLDILKLICAFLVICIHNPYKNTFWFWVEPWTRVAVPVFFMISGYFYKVDQQFKRGQVVKVFKLSLLWYFIYGVMEFVVKLQPVSIQGWIEYTKENLVQELLKFVLANKPMLNLGGALWYLFALGYVYLIYGFAAGIHKTAFLVRAGILLMILQYVFGMYAFVFGISTASIRTRNFLLTGIPFFGLGIWLQQALENNKRILKNITFIRLLVIAFLLSSVGEKYILVKYIGLEINSDLYLSTLFLAIALFLYALAKEEKERREFWVTRLALAGRNYSTGIYLIHTIVLCCMDQILYRLGVTVGTVYYSFPILIFLVSLLCVKLYTFLLQNLQKKVCM